MSQTGSGKTFTITGGPARYEDRGLLPRALAMVFEEMRQAKGGVQYQVRPVIAIGKAWERDCCVRSS